MLSLSPVALPLQPHRIRSRARQTPLASDAGSTYHRNGTHRDPRILSLLDQKASRRFVAQYEVDRRSLFSAQFPSADQQQVGLVPPTWCSRPVEINRFVCAGFVVMGFTKTKFGSCSLCSAENDAGSPTTTELMGSCMRIAVAYRGARYTAVTRPSLTALART
jgi:hypothetical protein